MKSIMYALPVIPMAAKLGRVITFSGGTPTFKENNKVKFKN